MEVVRGYVSGCRRSVSGAETADENLVTQILTFRIGGQAVELTLTKMPQIEEGDEISVAGDLHQGNLVGLAFMNWSNGTYDRRFGSLLGGIFAFGVLFVVGAFLSLMFPPLFFVAPFIVFPSGLIAYRSWRATQALSLARGAAPIAILSPQ